MRAQTSKHTAYHWDTSHTLSLKGVPLYSKVLEAANVVGDVLKYMQWKIAGGHQNELALGKQVLGAEIVENLKVPHVPHLRFGLYGTW